MEQYRKVARGARGYGNVLASSLSSRAILERLLNQPGLEVGRGIIRGIPESVRHWREDQYQDQDGDITHHHTASIQRCYVIQRRRTPASYEEDDERPHHQPWPDEQGQ